MASELQKLLRRLGASRGALTKSCNKIDQFRNNEDVDLSELQMCRDTLQSQIDRLEHLNDLYDKLNSEVNEEEMEEEYEKMENYREKGDNYISVCKTLLDCNSCSDKQNPSSVNVKLPKLSLPVFTGDVLKWNEFYESFIEAVDKQSISAVEKLQYLKSFLRGDALSMLEGLPLTHANYSTALELLKGRFGSKRRVLRAHIRSLLSLSPPNAKVCASLRGFVDNVNKHTRGLESLDVMSENYEVILTEILLSKMSKEIKYEFAKLEEEDVGISHLLSILEKEAKLQDMMASSTDLGSKEEAHHSTPKHRLNKSFTSQSQIVKCPICNSTDHAVYKCSKFVAATPKERNNIARQHHLCFNCLGQHMFNKCTSQSRCKTCGKPHNSMLHFEINTKENATVNVSKVNDEKEAVLPIISIPLQTVHGTQRFGALLDTGSDKSFIRQEALESVIHKVRGKRDLKIQGFHSGIKSERVTIVEVMMQSSVGHFEPLHLISTINMNPIAAELSIESLPSDLNVQYTDRPQSAEIIIGADNYFKLVTGNSKSISDDLRLMETCFGWTPHGLVPRTTRENSYNAFFVSSVSIDDSIDIKKFWNDELAGILPQEEEEVDVISEFEKNVCFDKNRYTIKLPWKNNFSMSSNYHSIAQGRLYNTVKKLLQQKKLSAYDEIIKGYEREGIVEQCHINEEESCRYIPHHPVIKESASSTKIRIVFDGSSKETNDVSINECLYEGPNLFPDLIGVLLRFRLFRYAFVTDITKAFLQIGVDTQDRNYLRFLWYDEKLDQSWPTERPTAYRFCRVPFGLRASPFLLNQTIKHHLKQMESKYPVTVSYLHGNIYVDDVIMSIEDNSDLKVVMKESVEIFNEMSMVLHKWHGNFTEIVQEGTTCSVLGISWNTEEDSLSLKFNCDVSIKTKRQLASVLCSFYDPFGLFLPFSNRLKVLMHQSWSLNLEWDQHLPNELLSDLAIVLENAVDVSNFQLNRWFLYDSTCCNIELHGFGDASSVLYATCIYLYFEKNGEKYSHLICAKSRVVPKRKLTIPKLELLAALLTARLMTKVISYFPNNTNLTSKCFSDSQVVLHWIKSNKTHKQFVQNRLNEIKRLFPVNTWSYIQSKSNPADLASRVFPNNSFLSNTLWWHGPDLSCLEEFPETDELRHEETHSFHTTTNVREPILEVERFSKYIRLLRTIWYVRRFCKLAEKQFDFKEEEGVVVRMHQEKFFPDELHDLLLKEEIDNKSSLRQLCPFVDQKGILRVSGRLQDSNANFSMKHPMIIAKNSHLAFLIASYCHEVNLHAGVATMCCEIRKEYWIPQCRRLCKRIVQRCVKCQRYASKSYNESFCHYPSDRVNSHARKPFQFTGLDYLGPIVTLSNGEKLYVLLLTCLQVRAIHLECTTSLNTSQFCQALSRFFSRRGTPQQIRSDNAKTFKCAAQKICSSYKISWKFNVEKAPWCGGTWERLVRNVKASLRHSISRCSNNYIDFSTLLCYIEKVVNSRPLTYTTGNDNELIPLTPENFIHPNDSQDCSTSLELSQIILSNALSCTHKTVNLFWTRWKKEYVAFLNQLNKSSNRQDIHIGKICFLNESSKRQYWPLVRIVELLPSRDKKCRAVKILCRGKVISRPIKLLIPLELPDL